VLLDGGEHLLGDGAELIGNARLSGGSPTVVGNVTTSGANAMSGGTLEGDGLFQIGGPFAWTGGQMAGTGTTRVLPGATVTHSTNSVALWEERTLEIGGVMELATAERGIGRSSAPLLHVLAGGVLRKTSTGLGWIDPALDNDGRVEATAGNFELNNGSGGETSTGTFGGPGLGGVTMLDGGDHLLGGAAALAGSARISGGTVTIADTASASGANSMTGGTIEGPGVFAVNGPLDWSGGQMAGTGTTRIAPGATVTLLTNSVALWGTRTLENGGTMLLTTPDRGLGRSGTPRLHNLASGLIRKTSGGGGWIDPAIENDGRIEATVADGVLELNNGGGSGEATGTFGAAGAAGLVRLDTGTFPLGNGADLLTGSRIAGATVNVANGATAVANGSAMSGGTLGGTGLLSIAGPFTWSGGRMDDAGRTRVEPGAVLTHAGGTSVGVARTIENAGQIAFTTDSGILDGSFSTPEPVLHNLAGAVLRKSAGGGTTSVGIDVRNDGLAESTSGILRLDRGAATAHTGTFRGASEAARVVLGTNFFSDDHLLGAGADLEGVVESLGDVRVAAGTVQAVDDTLLLTGGAISGDLDITGLLKWTDGNLDGPGTATVRPAGELHLDDACGAGLGNGRRIVNEGLVRLTRGSDVFSFGDPRPEIENAGTLRLDGTETGTCVDEVAIGGNVLVHNTGTIEKTGAVEGRIDGTLDNDGALTVSGGDLRLGSDEDVTHDGSFGAVNPGNLIFDSGTFLFGPAATLTGNAVIEFADVVVPDAATFAVPAGNTLTLAGGTLSGAGDLEVEGTLAWRDGSLEGRGTTVIAPGGRAVVGGDEFDFASLGRSRALVNRGELVVSPGATLSMFEGGTILNVGILELQGTGTVEGDEFLGFGSGTLVHNVGVVRKTQAGVASLGSAVDNDGALEVLAGTLAARGLLNYSFEDDSLSGGSYVLRNSVLEVRGPIETSAARIVLDGAGAQMNTAGFGGPVQDALASLERNTAAGVLELAGGRSLTVDGGFVNAGVIGLGAGSTFAASEFRQTAGAVLRTAVASASSFGRLDAGGHATLAGRLDVSSPFRPAVGTQLHVLESSTRAGTFGTVTGADLGGGLHYDVDYAQDGVRLRGSTTPGSTSTLPRVALPDDVAEPVDEPAPAGVATTLAGDALVARGPWSRRGRYVVVARRGATLVARRVTGRALAIRARTCSRCGSVRITWAGRTRTVSLKSRRPLRRTLHVMRFARERTGTVRVRTTSARRVAVRALVIRP
jgi:hypothetical protein